MAERVPMSAHAKKVTVDNFSPDGTLRPEDGWVDMSVKWLITSQSVGSRMTVFGITVFPPGARHEIHRHPNAEETEYLVEGHGIARIGDDDVEVSAGDIVFAGVNEYHGFVNTSATERAVMVWCYGGASSLADAGYMPEPKRPEA